MAEKKRRLAEEIAAKLHHLDRYLDAADLFRSTPSSQAEHYLREQSDTLAEEIECLLREFDRLVQGNP